MFDFSCAHCGAVVERLVWPSQRLEPQRCGCGREMARVWVGRCATVIDDTIPGGIVLENLSKTPQRYYSRTEIKDAMRALNVEQKVRHVGEPGSDRSKHTTRWV